MNSLDDIAEFLYKNDNFLIAAHAKPDGDACGSALGMLTFLRSNGKQAQALFADDIPDKFKKISDIQYLQNLDDWNDGFDSLIVLDCARSLRLNSTFELSSFKGTVINIDHHADNDVQGNLNYVAKNASACASICADLAKIMHEKYQWIFNSEAATWFYCGIVTDTGSFRFSNTDSAVLRAGAYLLEQGADSEKVINCAFFSKKENQQKFEADMMLNCIKREFDGRYVYAFLPQEMFDKYNFDMKDGEGVIEFLREIDNSIIAVLVYPKDNTLKVSLRSKDARYPVGPVARSLNGGGHEMASGITVRDMSADELLDALKNKIGELLQS